MQFIVQVNTDNRLTSMIRCTCTAMYLKSKNLQGKKAITIFSASRKVCYKDVDSNVDYIMMNKSGIMRRRLDQWRRVEGIL